jgi:hypothetical protein
MSAASKFPPIVDIPERARPASVTAGRPARPGHLSLVRTTDPRSCVLPTPATRGQIMADALLQPGPDARIATAAAPLRLTNRGLVVIALAVAGIAAAMLLVAHWSASPQVASPTTISSAVTVQPGDTLWSIARAIKPNQDPRAVVDQLIARNHLVGVALTPGQTIKVS